MTLPRAHHRESLMATLRCSNRIAWLECYQIIITVILDRTAAKCHTYLQTTLAESPVFRLGQDDLHIGQKSMPTDPKIDLIIYRKSTRTVRSTPVSPARNPATSADSRDPAEAGRTSSPGWLH